MRRKPVPDEEVISDTADAAPAESGTLEAAAAIGKPFPASVAALAILASCRLQDRFSDENDNEAQRQADGSVRLSLKLKEGGHERVFVRVPATVELVVVDAPFLPE